MRPVNRAGHQRDEDADDHGIAPPDVMIERE